MGNTGGKAGNSDRFSVLGTKINVDGDCSHKIRRDLFLGQKSCDKPKQCGKKQRHYPIDKSAYGQVYGLPSGHQWLWELDHKEETVEELMPSNCGAGEYSWDFLGQQGDQSNLKGNQPSIYVGRTDTEAETPVF